MSLICNFYAQFNESVERFGADANNQGADCIRVIMIFTDGGTTKERDIFEARNRYPFKVFSYD